LCWYCGHANPYGNVWTDWIKNQQVSFRAIDDNVIVKGEITRGGLFNPQRIDQDAALAARLQEDETAGGYPNNIVRIRDIGALALVVQCIQDTQWKVWMKKAQPVHLTSEYVGDSHYGRFWQLVVTVVELQGGARGCQKAKLRNSRNL
jgi:hypothetical protein